MAIPQHVSRKTERYYTTWDNHCNERDSQVHLGIQNGMCDHVLQCEISVQCRAHYRGCEENQRVTQDGKQAKQFPRGAGCQQHDDDRSVPGLSRERTSKVLFMGFVKKQTSGSFLFFVRWHIIKCVIAVQPSNNVKCIRCAEGHGRKKKLMIPSGDRAKRGAQFCPRAALTFSRPLRRVDEHAATR